MIIDVKGKTKDDINARRNFATHCEHRKLHIHTTELDDGGRTETVSNVPYVIGKNEVKALCEWLKELKLSDGYASNLSRCVGRKNGKLHNFKSHDCHVFMEKLLPIVVRELLLPNVWKVLTQLSQFFRDLCIPNLQMHNVLRLERNIPMAQTSTPVRFAPSYSFCPHLPLLLLSPSHVEHVTRVLPSSQALSFSPFPR